MRGAGGVDNAISAISACVSGTNGGVSACWWAGTGPGRMLDGQVVGRVGGVTGDRRFQAARSLGHSASNHRRTPGDLPALIEQRKFPRVGGARRVAEDYVPRTGLEAAMLDRPRGQPDNALAPEPHR